jgi:glycosyltransferase involved in cell wall biosynthesis
MSSIDVIISCYRYGHFLAECVNSILSQSVPDLRVLILDDASPDNTPEVAAELAASDPRVSVIRHATNKGHIATYNEGIEWLTADYYLLISADDYLLAGALRRAADCLDSHSDAGFVFGSCVEAYSDGSETYLTPIRNFDPRADQVVVRGEDFIRTGGCRNIVPTPTAIVRTDLQKHVGGYRSELPHAGDMEMWWRLAAHARVGILASRQAVYRRHAANMSHNYNLDNRLPDLMQRKAVVDIFFEKDGRELAGQLIDDFLAALSLDAIGYASAVLNSADLELAAKFSSFAEQLHPEIKRTPQRRRYALKRWIGPQKWSVLRPAADVVRKAIGR